MSSCSQPENYTFRNIPEDTQRNPEENSSAASQNNTDSSVPLLNPAMRSPVDSGNTPVIPLPNPGEGGSIFPDGNSPVFPFPNPDEVGSAFPGGNSPIFPFPTPGSGTPIAPDTSIIIPIFPSPNPPCFFCGTGKYEKVRFLNAAFGYQPFRIFVNNRYIVGGLGYTSLTPYGRVASGFQTITVTGTNGYIFIQKTVPFRTDEISTVAIINTPSGLDLLKISDAPCAKPNNMSCLRACNLAMNSNPLDVILYDGRVVFSDVTYKETTDFKRIRTGEYQFYLAETNLRPMPRFQDIETLDSAFQTFTLPDALVSFFVNVRATAMYTIYIFSLGNQPNELQTRVIEDR